MNTYAIITYSDGAFLIREEYTSKDAAIIGYDGLHAALIGDQSCREATIKLVDNQLNVVDGKYFDKITHAEVTKKSTKKEN